ncbi:MAG: GGDEF domain-containing protein [Clostridia bacterium]|nr:GGDEF domain-containing protein [Clostridia bacterium]
MRDFQISRYIRKWLPWIVAVCLIATVGVYVFLSVQQVYVASAVIRYTSEDAAAGLTPMQTELDVDEIRSSGIMSKVLTNLELDDKAYSVDDLIARFKIVEVLDEDEAARKEAILDEGLEYTIKPTTYIVSFEATNDEGESFARMVLDETLDVYFSQYSERYVNVGPLANSLDKLYASNYDYIEILEIIESNIAQTLEGLGTRSQNSPYFRSAATGMTFGDLMSEFRFIQSVKISDIYADIFKNQVTKDKNLLIARYNDQIRQNSITTKVEEERIADLMVLINEYVTKMSESGNTNITWEYILDDVYHRDLTDMSGQMIGSGDQTVTYDRLIYGWSTYSDSKEYALVDSAYSQYVIDVFAGCVSGCEVIGAEEEAETVEAAALIPFLMTEEERRAAEEAKNAPVVHICSESTLTCAAQNMHGYDEVVKSVEEKIDSLLGELAGLYAVVDSTNEEYNRFIGADNISMLSTVSIDEGMNVKLYTALAAVFLLVVCCCGAIFLGRINDIVEYAFYTDHMTGMRNRTAFDNYLKSNDKTMLGGGEACVAVTIANQAEVNEKFGRETGDELIKFFAESMKDAFGKNASVLVYNGKAQFIAMLDNMDAAACEYAVQHFALMIEKRQSLQDVGVEYDMGYAQTQRDDVYRVRGLLSKAISQQVRYGVCEEEQA